MFEFLKPLKKVKNEWIDQEHSHWRKYGTLDWLQITQSIKPEHPCCFGAHLARAHNVDPWYEKLIDREGYLLEYSSARGERYFYEKIGLKFHHVAVTKDHIRENRRIFKTVHELFSTLKITKLGADPFGPENWLVEWNTAFDKLESKGETVLKKLKRRHLGIQS